MITQRRVGAVLLAATFAFAGCSMMPASLGGTAGSGGSVTSTMAASQEVPANASPGTGTVLTRLDRGTRTLTYTITYSGLTGPVTAGHFHGPAAPGANAGVALPFSGTASPIQGSAVLTEAQMADFVAGKWYANLHTAATPGGEIRGQVAAR